MVRDIPSLIIWTAHLNRRFDEATANHLVGAGTKLSLQSAKVFVPANVSQEDFTASDPNESLRSLLKEEPPAESGWVRREDLFDEIAEWLHATYPHLDLFCEAGFLEIGDSALSKRQYVVHEGRPFLHMEIGGSNISPIATMLRWGRSLRFLGVIPSDVGRSADRFLPASGGLFICDAYHGDSLIFAETQACITRWEAIRADG